MIEKSRQGQTRPLSLPSISERATAPQLGCACVCRCVRAYACARACVCKDAITLRRGERAADESSPRALCAPHCAATRLREGEGRHQAALRCVATETRCASLRLSFAFAGVAPRPRRGVLWPVRDQDDGENERGQRCERVRACVGKGGCVCVWREGGGGLRVGVRLRACVRFCGCVCARVRVRVFARVCARARV